MTITKALRAIACLPPRRPCPPPVAAAISSVASSGWEGAGEMDPW